MDDQNSANYKGFSLVSGGLIYSLTSVFRRKAEPGKDLKRLATALVLITWVPLCLLALLSDTLNDNATTISFFEDFLVHVRFLLVVPFLILIENIVDRTFVGYIQNSDDLIPKSQQESFNLLVKRMDKLTNSYIPEILMLIIVCLIYLINWQTLYIFDSGRNYLTHSDEHKLNAAGWYYLLVCSPIFQLLVFRWIWRWIVWVYSIIRISRFKLHVDPLHADQMAGLEYLNLCPLTFGFILMAPSAVLSSIIGIDIIYHGAVLQEYIFHIAVYVIILPIVLYSPLLIFMPLLIEAKSYGILNFGNLLRKHNHDYVAKWIKGDPPKNEPLLGTMDNSSLADINGSYAPIQGIKLVPIDFKMILMSFALNVVPYIPLVFTYYSASDLFKTLIKNVIGG